MDVFLIGPMSDKGTNADPMIYTSLCVSVTARTRRSEVGAIIKPPIFGEHGGLYM